MQRAVQVPRGLHDGRQLRHRVVDPHATDRCVARIFLLLCLTRLLLEKVVDHLRPARLEHIAGARGIVDEGVELPQIDTHVVRKSNGLGGGGDVGDGHEGRDEVEGLGDLFGGFGADDAGDGGGEVHSDHGGVVLGAEAVVQAGQVGLFGGRGEGGREVVLSGGCGDDALATISRLYSPILRYDR